MVERDGEEETFMHLGARQIRFLPEFGPTKDGEQEMSGKVGADFAEQDTKAKSARFWLRISTTRSSVQAAFFTLIAKASSNGWS